MPETVTVRNDRGEALDIPAELVDQYTARGFKLEQPGEQAERVATEQRSAEYGGPVGQFAAAGLGALGTVTGGASDVALRALGGGDTIRALHEENPFAHTAGAIAGAFFPVGFAGAVTGVGKGVAEGLGGGLLARAAGGASEGALYGLGGGVTDLALSRDPLTVERATSALSSNMLFAGALGGGLGLAGAALERGLSRAKGAIDTALEKRAVSKARTPTEAIETGDLSLLDNGILDAAERDEIARIAREQAPQREAFVNELDAWRKSNRDTHDLRASAQGSDDPNLREASGAFDRANFRLRSALDDRVGFAEDPLKSLKAVRSQGQALEDMKAAAAAHEVRWRQDVADAPLKIRSALEEVSALGRRPATVPEYGALNAQLDSIGQDAIEQTVSARSLAEHGYYEPPGGGVDKVRAAKAARAIEEGQQEAIRLNVTPSGKIVVDDGRHRLAAAARADKPIRVKWSTGFEPSADMVLRSRSVSGGPELLAARRKLAAELGLGDEIGPYTEAGIDAATERVLAERMGYQWGGAIKGGLRTPSIVTSMPTIERMIAANQRLQGQLEALAKPPTSELLTKISEARAVLNAPKEASPGRELLSMAAPFAGPLGAAAAAGARALGTFRKAASAVGERAAKAASAFLDVTGKATAKAAQYLPAATKVLSSVRFAPAADHDRAAPTGNSLPALYRARTDEIKSQTAYDIAGIPRLRPEARAVMAARLKPIQAVDPILADQMETAATRRIEYLSSLIPRRPSIGGMPIGPDHWQPSDMEMRSFARSVAAVEDPHAVFERALHGAVTTEDIDAMRAVHPEILADWINSVSGQLPTLQHALPFARLISLSMMTGKPLHPAMDPAIMGVLQAQFQYEPEPAGPTANPQFGSVKNRDEIGTASQRREEGTA